MSGVPSASRLYFFDNVRYLVIIWVTLFHVASGLAGHQEFIRDSNTSAVFSVFHAYSVTVMMAIMFFTAGYFSTPSLRNRTRSRPSRRRPTRRRRASGRRSGRRRRRGKNVL